MPTRRDNDQIEPRVISEEKPPFNPRLYFPPRSNRLWAVLMILTYVLGLGSGYFIREQGFFNQSSVVEGEKEAEGMSEIAGMVSQINPYDGYQIPVQYGKIGPQLLEAGAIDLDKFVQVYEQSGNPLSRDQIDILQKGSDEQIVIDRNNAHFLLNLFWALGLTNFNPLLTDGPMVQFSEGQIERFASTGGWTIAAKEITELYASSEIINLTPDQHAHVEEVAMFVYRPCCNNPTHFPDCNHGMAMLGLLQLMASQGSTVEEMFSAAKYVNAFWFPQQNLELAIFFKAAQDLEFDEVDARKIVGPNFSSGSGANAVRQWLGEAGLLEPAPSQGAGCGV
jgi:hypothetical protein